MNRHIKVINGRKYYYSSIRNGKKVTSKYLGPVERIRRSRKPELENTPENQMPEDTTPEEDENYIG